MFSKSIIRFSQKSVYGPTILLMLGSSKLQHKMLQHAKEIDFPIKALDEAFPAEVRLDLASKQFAGRAVKEFMNHSGFKVVAKKLYIPKCMHFKTGSLFKRVYSSDIERVWHEIVELSASDKLNLFNRLKSEL